MAGGVKDMFALVSGINLSVIVIVAERNLAERNRWKERRLVWQ